MRKPKKSNTQLLNRIGTLAGRLSELKKSDTVRAPGAVPVELRREAVALLGESALSLRKFGEQIGVSRTALCAWRKAERSKAIKAKKRFREVRVVAERVAQSAEPMARSFELALVGGARITGLRMEDVAKLLCMKEASR